MINKSLGLFVLVASVCLCASQQVQTKDGALVFSVPGATMTLNATTGCGAGLSGPVSIASQTDLQWAMTTLTNATNLVNTRIDLFSDTMAAAVNTAVALAVNAAVTAAINVMMVPSPPLPILSHSSGHSIELCLSSP